MGTKLNPGAFDCHAKALPDEPTFTILARDPDFALVVHTWASRRLDAIRRGERPESDIAAVREAIDCAAQAVEWRRLNNGKWRLGPRHARGAMVEASADAAALDVGALLPATAPDWPPKCYAGYLSEGHAQRGSTGQLFEVRGGQWVRVR